MSAAAINFFGARFLDDPYPFYRHMRETEPVMRQVGMRGTEWLLTRHADIRAVLGDRQNFIVDAVPDSVARAGVAAGAGEVRAGCERLAGNVRDWLFFIDPPEHTRRRAPIARAFTPQAIDALVPAISARVAQRLAGGGDTEIDVVQDLGTWLPAATVLDLLGVRDADVAAIAQAGSAVFAVFEQPASGARYAALAPHVQELETLVNRWMAAPAAHLGHGGLLRALLSHDGERAAFDSAWVPGFVTMLLAVGQDTTKHLLGNALAALAATPAAWQCLAAEPALAPAAVDELARYDTPVQLVARVAARDVVIGGQLLRQGERVYLFLGAALRDPEVFDRPDELVLDRARPAHLHFGGGPHYCLGAQIARAITVAVLQRLAAPGRRPPRMVDGRARRLRCVHLRGYASLPIQVDLS